MRFGGIESVRDNPSQLMNQDMNDLTDRQLPATSPSISRHQPVNCAPIAKFWLLHILSSGLGVRMKPDTWSPTFPPTVSFIISFTVKYL